MTTLAMRAPEPDMQAGRPALIRRVQRVPEAWPVLHLEATPPRFCLVTVDGLVDEPQRFLLDDLCEFRPAEHHVPLHCVWGWSRPDALWEGVRLGAVLDAARVRRAATHVLVASASGTYSSCLPISDAIDGVLACSRNGRPLVAETGGPLRFVAPAQYWGYKSVKWAARITAVDHFIKGFWESKVLDPLGRIPEEVQLP